jgi:hypothetical protein
MGGVAQREEVMGLLRKLSDKSASDDAALLMMLHHGP